MLAYSGIIIAFAWGPILLFFSITPNLYLAIFGSLFFLIGGGVPVAINTLNASAADVCKDRDK